MNDEYAKMFEIIEKSTEGSSFYIVDFRGFLMNPYEVYIECGWHQEEDSIDAAIYVHFSDEMFVLITPEFVRWLKGCAVSDDIEYLEGYDIVEIMISEDEKTVTVCLDNGEVLDIHICESKDTELSEVA